MLAAVNTEPSPRQATTGGFGWLIAAGVIECLIAFGFVAMPLVTLLRGAVPPQFVAAAYGFIGAGALLAFIAAMLFARRRWAWRFNYNLYLFLGGVLLIGLVLGRGALPPAQAAREKYRRAARSPE